jgi:hypothetical protein
MRLFRLISFLGFVMASVAIAVSQEPPVRTNGKFVPPEGKVLLIVGQDVDNIEAYLSSVKLVPGGFAAYTSVEEVEGLSLPADQYGGVQYAQSLLDRNPNTVLQLALYMVDYSQKVYSGDLDASIDQLADWLRSVNRPVYLRIGYEFDYPDNAYDPRDYIRAYRYLVKRLRDKGVTNVATVWHSYADTVYRPYEDWYPGDDYVDWFAISYFDQSRTYMDKMVALAKRHKKPVMIAEASPWFWKINESDGAWKGWFLPMLKFVQDNDVKAISYINCDWDKIPLFQTKGWGDTRVQSNKKLMEKWLKEFSQEKYLKASPTLFEQLGYTPPAH